MSENEGGLGEVSKLDQAWPGTRFLMLFAMTLGTCLVIIYVIASLKTDFGWHPFAHDLIRHTFENSTF